MRAHPGLLALLGLLALAAPAPAAAEKKPLPAGERIDLNRASAAELMRLPGVGRKRAEAIVAHRERRPFRRAEDVLQVKGLSPAWLARVKGSLTVGEPPAPRPAEARGAGDRR